MYGDMICAPSLRDMLFQELLQLKSVSLPMHSMSCQVINVGFATFSNINCKRTKRGNDNVRTTQQNGDLNI